MQELGQKPSLVPLHVRIALVHWNVQFATDPLRVRMVFLSPTHMSNWGWQLVDGGSQVSFGSMTPLPQTG